MNWKSKLLVRSGLWHDERCVSLEHSQNMMKIVSRIGTWAMFELSSYLLLLSSYIWMLIGFYWDKNGSEHPWFQPAGAVVLLSAVLSEFTVVDTSKKVRAHIPDFVKITSRYKRIRLVFFYFGFFSIVLGTLVWAYGDRFV